MHFFLLLLPLPGTICGCSLAYRQHRSHQQHRHDYTPSPVGVRRTGSAKASCAWHVNLIKQKSMCVCEGRGSRGQLPWRDEPILRPNSDSIWREDSGHGIDTTAFDTVKQGTVGAIAISRMFSLQSHSVGVRYWANGHHSSSIR